MIRRGTATDYVALQEMADRIGFSEVLFIRRALRQYAPLA
jgi:hypothetical protein